MDELLVNLSKIDIPSAQTAIYKDECVYSFDTPEAPTGLYVNLTTYLGFGEDYAIKYAQHTGNRIFLHIKREKFLKEAKNEGSCEGGGEECGPERKITRLAIGVEGGYKDEARKYEYKDTLSIAIMPDIQNKIPYTDSLPLLITEAVRVLLQQESAIEKLEKQVLTGTWDGEVRHPTKLSDSLVQLNNGKKIPPSGWKCEKCNLTNNLWLNLTDGSILCGRKFFDGSGGNDHAVEHYRETGYPLAVKLGTIADGQSDVFSYPEDDMVIDTKLEQHLAHFGINMAAMKKSEKSMVELELEINQRIGEWSLLTESDCELQPMCGPGYTGMRNLGNSCYINSVMQVIFTIPDFIRRFVGEGANNYFNKFPSDPANDFNIQMAKLGNGLWSGKYSSVSENSLDSESTGIAPSMFKNVIGKDHPDFSTKQQQDAYLFYLHFINMLERNSRHQFNPADALTFCLEDRIECLASRKIKYTRRSETALPLEIPLEEATNLDEVKEYLEKKAADGANTNDKDVVRHKVPLLACLNKFFAPELIEQFYSPAIKSNTTAKKQTRLGSMPDYLMLHMKRFTLGDDWVPKKLDVSVEMPDEIDLSNWRGHGLQPGEEEWPETGKDAPKFEFDHSVLSELMQMGFPMEACKRAIYHTSNSGLEAASNWIMEHIGDADISDPFEVPSNAQTRSADAFVPNAESMETLMGMGFDEKQVVKALKATDGNVERATDWIFSHADDMDTSEPHSNENPPTSSEITYRDGVGKYKLVAFISHMGTSTKVGHYVCHIRKDDQWVIYNDSKVAKSQNPPKDLGYMYLYKRGE